MAFVLRALAWLLAGPASTPAPAVRTATSTVTRRASEPVDPPASECHAHAMKLLRGRNFHASRVVRVDAEGDSDVILWLDQKGEPRTTVARREEAADGKERTSLSEPHPGFVVP